MKKGLLYTLLVLVLVSFFEEKNLMIAVSQECYKELQQESFGTIDANNEDDFSKSSCFQKFSLAPQCLSIPVEHSISNRIFPSFKYWLSQSFYFEHCKTLLRTIAFTRKLYCSYIAERGYYIYCLRKILI